MILYAPVGRQQWHLGVVLTVWRSTAKGGAKPTPYPVPLDAAKCLRIAELSELSNCEEGTYVASSDSVVNVIPAYRLGLVLKTSTAKGIDGIKVSLVEQELEIFKAAKSHVFAQNPDSKANLQMNRKRKACETLSLVSEDEDGDEAKPSRSKSSKPVSKDGKILKNSSKSSSGFIKSLCQKDPKNAGHGKTLTKDIEALPGNFDRYRKGDQLIRQEMQRLIEHHNAEKPDRPILTPEGRVRLRDPKTGSTYVGHPWSNIVERAPTFFSNKFRAIRNKDLYGQAVHTEFVKMTKSRTDFLRTIHEIPLGTVGTVSEVARKKGA